ncbi:MAG: chemotaxis protein CheA [candidate division Zixibacteria bacterium]|nr:chemotaxis protein CheA [candidate division Zixibacteria bacterium]
MGSIINEFLVESYENLDQLDRQLVELEQTPTEKKLLSSIFRTIHTIKGTCGFLGYSKLESVAHIGENLLSRLRDGALTLSPEITSGLLAMVDAIRQILGSIEGERNEGTVDYTNLIETLTRLNKGERVFAAPAAASAPVAPAPAPAAPEPVAVAEAAAPVAAQPAAPVAEPVKIVEDKRQTEPAEEAAFLAANKDRRTESRGVSETSIRVDVSLLDKLMNLVGELVLARNQILQYTPPERDSTFIASTQTLNLITTELQEGVMKTRMQPIGNIWDKFPRVVRDLSLSCGKQVALEMEGKDTELDKTLIEAIKDPLTHIVRNSVDHGIETPDKRTQSGKSPEGRLVLRAYHEGGQVNIEISDDGAGINPEKVKQKALEKNLITPEQASRMTDRELVNLIFLPGFSTAEKVTNVSGRGVGMDVVRTNIEKIGGTVDLQGKPGVGTTLRIKIPLTLAIIPALTVNCGGNRYAIPQVSLLELVRLDGEEAKAKVEMIKGTPVYRLRGNLLPLVYLDRELKVPKASNDDVISIVVLQADDRQFGLVVDGINDTEEIVVKPLGKQLKGVTAYAGATIMGDGKVALILDVMGLAQRAQVIREGRDRAGLDQGAKAKDTSGDTQTLLILGIGETTRMAIPLSLVARLEEFRLSEIERSGDQDMVQYCGEIMPLIYLNRLFHAGRPVPQSDPMQAVVYTSQGRSVGFVVDQIIDIVEESITVKRTAKRAGIVGTIVVQNRVTDLVDIEGVIRDADPTFFEEQTQPKLIS